MKQYQKKIAAVALTGLMGLGMAAFSPAEMSAEAAAGGHRYEDGTSNEYSHRLREESDRHEHEVRESRGRYRRGEKDVREYEEELSREQRRHDHEMRKIRDDYESHRHHNRQ